MEPWPCRSDDIYKIMAGSNLKIDVKSPFRQDRITITEKGLRLHICCVKIRQAKATARSISLRSVIDFLKAIIISGAAKKELE